MRNSWAGKTFNTLREDMRDLKKQMSCCGNPEEKELLQDRLAKLRQARRCYLRWLLNACCR